MDEFIEDCFLVPVPINRKESWNQNPSDSQVKSTHPYRAAKFYKQFNHENRIATAIIYNNEDDKMGN